MRNWTRGCGSRHFQLSALSRHRCDGQFWAPARACPFAGLPEMHAFRFKLRLERRIPAPIALVRCSEGAHLAVLRSHWRC